MRAVAVGPVHSGDKDNEDYSKTTQQSNVGHIPDVLEPGASDSGHERLLELRVKNEITSTRHAGVGATPADVGHIVAFGNTYEFEHTNIHGHAARGHIDDKPFNHADGLGYIAMAKGQYDDAKTKGHTTIGFVMESSGALSKPAAGFMRRLGRDSRARDGTRYGVNTPTSFLSYHMQALSLATSMSQAEILIDGVQKTKAAAHACRGHTSSTSRA